MRAILFDAADPGHHECRQAADALRRALGDAGFDVQNFPLAELPISPCRGCFACWLATPGSCPHADPSELVARAAVNAPLAVFFSPLVFGGYGWVLKKALDRMICLISPFFETKGLTRHTARYKRYPAMLGVGWLPGPDPESQAIFTRVVTQNAYNLRAPAQASLVLTADKDWAVHRKACLTAIRSLLP